MLSREFLGEDGLEPFDQYKFHDLEAPSHPQVKQVKSDQHLKDIIEANCGTMLAAYRATNYVLYRGLDTHRDIVATNIRPDRKPVEMHHTIHKWLEQAFIKLGLKANRSNSIFATCSLRTAYDWGLSPYVIFVKDGWSATVFKQATTGYVFNRLAYGINDLVDAIEKVKKLLPRNVVGTKALATVLRVQYNDILITGESYIGISVDRSDLINFILGFDHRTGAIDKPVLVTAD